MRSTILRWFLFRTPGGYAYVPAKTEEEAAESLRRNSDKEVPIIPWPLHASAMECTREDIVNSFLVGL